MFIDKRLLFNLQEENDNCWLCCYMFVVILSAIVHCMYFIHCLFVTLLIIDL